MKGRFGPYVTDGRKRARVPKDQEAESLTKAQCQALVDEAPEPKGRGGTKRKSTAGRKTAGSKASASKAPSKSSGGKRSSGS